MLNAPQHAYTRQLIAAVPPLRRAGRPAAMVSIAMVLTSLASAIRNWQLSADAPVREVWDWLPGPNGPLATMGILVDHQSTLMLILIFALTLAIFKLSSLWVFYEAEVK